MSYKFRFLFSIFFFLLLGLSQILKGQEELSNKLTEAKILIYSEPEKAISLAEEVYKKSNENSIYQLSALITIGTAYSEKNEINKSIETLLKALEIAQFQSDYVNQVRILSLVGYQYQIMEMNEKTHRYLDEAELIIESHGLPDSLVYLRGNNYSIKALAYQQTLDCDYAIEYFNKAISTYKRLKNNEVSKTNLCIGYLNKAACFLEDEKIDSAKTALIEGDKIINEISLTDDIVIAQQIGWARYYLLIKDYQASIKILHRNLQKAKVISQLGIDMEIYQLLSQNYFAVNNIEQYNHYSNLYIETKKIHSESEKKSITHIINKKPVAELETLNNSTIILYVILSIVFILILFFVIKSYRLQRKLKNLKANQDSEL